MNFLALAKLSRALFLFIREMWLRDRTFRQFVHENLALIVCNLGFLVMAYLFTYVYFMAAEQKKVIIEHEQRYARLRDEYDKDVAFLTERMEWHRDRYLELKAPPVKSIEPVYQKPTGTNKTHKPKSKSTTPDKSELDYIERWNKLSE
ncbi:hypothetical protein D3C85_13650 [compost metagenome]